MEEDQGLRSTCLLGESGDGAAGAGRGLGGHGAALGLLKLLSRAKEFVLGLSLRDADLLEVALDGTHEGLGPEEVDVDVSGSSREPTLDEFLADASNVVGLLGASLEELVVGEEVLDVRVLGDECLDVLVEGVDLVVASEVDVGDVALLGGGVVESVVEHREERGETDAAADQNEGLLGLGEHEVSSGREEVDLVSNVHLIVEVIGDEATLLALDGEAVVLTVGRIGERVVATNLLAVDGEGNTSELTGGEVQNLLAILGLPVEGGDFGRLDLLLPENERTLATPASRLSRTLRVDLLLSVDQDVGQLTIGGLPGIDDGVGRYLGTQNFANRGQQVGSNDRVPIGRNVERDVLVDDLSGEVSKTGQVLNVAGILKHRVGEGARLRASGLVGLVEEDLHLGVVREHALVEVLRKGFASGFQDGDGGLDEGDLIGSERHEGWVGWLGAGVRCCARSFE